MRTLKNELIRLGEIDINEQAFIDEAFGRKNSNAYRFLVSAGIDTNAASSDGRTLLHRVAATGDVQLMQYLVRREASLTTADNNGVTPVQVFQKRYANSHQKIDEFRRAFPP